MHLKESLAFYSDDDGVLSFDGPMMYCRVFLNATTRMVFLDLSSAYLK